MTENNNTAWAALPTVVTTYLTAHRTRDVATALAAFTTDAAVTDEGQTVHGRDAVSYTHLTLPTTPYV